MLTAANAPASTGLTAYEPLHAHEQTENREHGFGSEFSLKWAHLNMRSVEVQDMFAPNTECAYQMAQTNIHVCQTYKKA